jgi:hypothetical protein
MQQVTSVSDGKPGSKISLVSVQQVWNELIVSVACHAIDLAHNFMNLHCVAHGIDNSKKCLPGTSLKSFLKVDERISNADRIRVLFEGLNTVEILMQMTALSYRKACRLKLIKFRLKSGEETEKVCVESTNEPVIVVDHATDAGVEIENRLVKT